MSSSRRRTDRGHARTVLIATGVVATAVVAVLWCRRRTFRRREQAFHLRFGPPDGAPTDETSRDETDDQKRIGPED